MPNVTRWNPYDELNRLRDEFQRALGSGLFGPWLGRAGSEWGPTVDVRETVDGFVVQAELPGVDPGSVDVTVAEDSVSLRGEVRQEQTREEGGYRQIERRYGSFARTIPLPSPVAHEQAKADYKHGILEIRVPKSDNGRLRSTRVRIDEPR